MPPIHSPGVMFVCERDVQALNWTQRNVSGLLLAESSFPCSLMKDGKAKRGLPWLFLAVASLFKQWLDAFWRNKRKHMDWISPKHTAARSGLEARCGRVGRRGGLAQQAGKQECHERWAGGSTSNVQVYFKPGTVGQALGISDVYDGTCRTGSYCIRPRGIRNLASSRVWMLRDPSWGSWV